MAKTADEMHNGLRVFPRPGLQCCCCDECRTKRAAKSEEGRIKNERKRERRRELGLPVTKTERNEAERLRQLEFARKKAERKANASAVQPKAKNQPVIVYPVCPCGKFAYPDRISAEVAAVSLAFNRVSKDVMRAYECPRSGRWHLTNQSLSEYTRHQE